MREVALAKSWSFAIVDRLIPPAQHGLRERSVNVREVTGSSTSYGRMPVEGIAERPAVEDHIERRYRTVELGRYSGAHPSCTCTAVHEQLSRWTSCRRPTSAAGLERSFLQRKVQLDAESEAMNVDRKHKSALCNQDLASGLPASPASRWQWSRV